MAVDWDKLQSGPPRVGRFIAIDAEYQAIPEAKVPVICFAMQSEEGEKEFHWNDLCGLGWGPLETTLNEIEENRDVLVSFNVVAEATALLGIGIDPARFLWIDPMVMWKNYRNGKPQYNKVLVGDGPDNLLNVTSIILGNKVDKEEKDRMRDLVINARYPDPHKDLEERGFYGQIKAYCESDVGDLIELYRELERLSGRTLEQELWAGEYMVNTAKEERKGVPINTGSMDEQSSCFGLYQRQLQDSFRPKIPRLFSAKTKKSEKDMFSVLTFSRGTLQKECDRLAKSYEWAPGNPPAKGSKKYKEWKSGKIDYLEACGNSTSVDMLKYAMKFYGIENEIINQHTINYLEAIKRTNYFSPPAKGRKSWLDFTGRDEVMRPYLNPYGSITMRNYPQAKGFLPANSPFVASHLEIPEGQCMIEMDYGQQEFLINGVLSGDKNILADYQSGDPYIALAKRAHRWDGKKETRGVFKAANLGFGFGLQPFGFMWKFRTEQLQEMSIEQARELYDCYWNSYWVYGNYRDELDCEFQRKQKIMLKDGTMLHHHKGMSRLSYLNFPTQANGGVVLRKAINLSFKRHLDVRFPFHDAIYIFSDYDRVYDDLYNLKGCMQEGWKWTFPEAPDIKLGATIYGRGEVDTGFFDFPVEIKEYYNGKGE